MKRNSLAILVVLILFDLLACSSSSFVTTNTALTNERVQRALNQWAGGQSATVTGIQEFPNENRAVAQVTFNELKTAPYSRSDMQERSTLYSGDAEANLVHYNDGRWVITRIWTFPSHTLDWKTLNIEVK